MTKRKLWFSKDYLLVSEGIKIITVSVTPLRVKNKIAISLPPSLRGK